MRILAVDTALTACTVALGGEQGLLASRSVAMTRGHAEALMPMISEVLAQADLRLADIDRFAATTGPGTFTGVRVGLAAVRGFALAVRRQAVGLTTLEALAATALDAGPVDGPFLVAMDARRGEIYAQCFGADGSSLSGPRVGPADEIATGLDPAIRHVVGSGAEIAATAAPGLAVAGDVAVPSPGALLRVAGAAAEPAAPPRPLYLRAPDAKPQAGARIARR